MSTGSRTGGPVDPRFAHARDRARARRRRATWRRGGLVLLGGAALAGLVVATGLVTLRESPSRPGPAPAERAAAPPPEATPGTPAPPDPDRAPPRFMDLPGSPLRIETGGSAQSAAPRRLPRPEGLPEGRGRGDILVIRDTLIPPGERLAVTLPTSQEDFAIFQAQRSAAAQRRASPPVTAGSATAPARPRNVAEARALIAQAQQAGRHPDFATLPLIPPERRHRLYDESVLRIARSAPVEAVLIREGLPEAEAARAADTTRELLGLDRLGAGHILALRWQSAPPRPPRFVQAAFYERDRYVGALALAPAEGPGVPETITTGSDPWIAQDLPARLDETASPGSRPAGPGAARGSWTGSTGPPCARGCRRGWWGR